MGTPPSVIDYRGSFFFPLTPEELWDAVSHTERFETWWRWLGDFRLEGGGLVDGAVLHGVVSPPVPYQMRVRIHLDRCRRPAHIEATVAGDLRGPATLALHPTDGGTRADVAWRIEMMQRPMRLAARVAGPLLHWGHDRVVDMTVAGFRRHLAKDPDRPV
ncbi:MAG: SRPBCC family protein [Acidimicrobiales bacterium]